jgi:hypothetical protein
MIVLDADDQFATVQEVAERLVAAGAISDLHLAGVGYGGGYHSPLNRRMLDYTPTPDPSEPANTGGAAPFLRFLTNELLPQLQELWPVDPARLGITGHSLGSLFGLFAITQAKSPFTHYLISSPSLWWHNRSVLAPLRQARQQPRPPRRAHFSVGDGDTESMRAELQELMDELRAHPIAWLQHTCQVLEGFDHYHSYEPALDAGLRWLWSVPSTSMSG